MDKDLKAVLQYVGLVLELHTQDQERLAAIRGELAVFAERENIKHNALEVSLYPTARRTGF